DQFVKPVTVVLILDFFMMSWLGSSPFLQSYSSEASWSLFTTIVLMLLLVADAFALVWVGLWLGLKGKRSWTTAFAALARIILLPTGVSLLIMMLLALSGGFRKGSPM